VVVGGMSLTGFQVVQVVVAVMEGHTARTPMDKARLEAAVAGILQLAEAAQDRQVQMERVQCADREEQAWHTIFRV